MTKNTWAQIPSKNNVSFDVADSHVVCSGIMGMVLTHKQ